MEEPLAYAFGDPFAEGELREPSEPDVDAHDVYAQDELDGIERDLSDVESALERLDQGSYGRCEVCGNTIDPATLSRMPSTRFCDEHLPLELA